jgi:hypothetical protein
VRLTTIFMRYVFVSWLKKSYDVIKEAFDLAEEFRVAQLGAEDLGQGGSPLMADGSNQR